MNKILAVLLFLIVLSSCADKKEQASEAEIAEVDIADQILGQWHNLEIKVIVKREHGDSVVFVPQDKWEEILKIKPIVTSFNSDSTFVSEYMSLDGEVIMTSTGTWTVEGDSLIMSERGVENAYYTTIKNDTVSFAGYIDWDEDGEADDFYTGTQIRH